MLRTTKCDAFSEARRTKNRLLRYGIRIRCSKRLPVVRDASSEAFGVKNRLFRYGRDTRYRKRPSGVPNASSEAFGVKNRLLRYGRDIRYRKQAPLVRDAFSETFGDKKGLLWHAMRFQRRAEQHLLHRRHLKRPAEQPTPQTVDSLLPQRQPLQRRAVPKAAPAHRTQLQCAKEPPLSLFAPAPYTISFVPLTRNLSLAAPSLAPSRALGTGNSPPLGGTQI